MMISHCKGCYRPKVSTYCAECRKALFEGSKIGHQLAFGPPVRNQMDVLASYNRQNCLTDILVEYELEQTGDQLMPAAENATHILKVVPTGGQERLEQLPANEHLTMQIARQIYNIDVAPNGYAVFDNSSPAYITRKLDSADGAYVYKYSLEELFLGKYPDGYKSVEQVALFLNNYIAAYKPQVERLFALAVFNYLFSIHGQAISQLSLLETKEGEYLLAPAYNLFCTELHEAGKPDVLYLNEDGDPYTRVNGYTYADFYTLALRIGMTSKRAERVLRRFTGLAYAVERMIDVSFLSEEGKRVYKELYKERLVRTSPPPPPLHKWRGG